MEKINQMKEALDLKVDNYKIDEILRLGRVQGDIMKYHPRLICIQYLTNMRARKRKASSIFRIKKKL
jgi:hypothetical protein